MVRVVAFPLLILYLLIRCARDRRYLRAIGERFGHLPDSFSGTPPGGIWFHAVSVGEVLSAVHLIRELRERAPNAPVFVSTTTLAGRAVAEEKLRGLATGVFYAPLDYGSAIANVLRTIRPAVVVILETEIWPLLFRRVKQAGCGLLVVNGRISDRALRRYRRWRWLFRNVLCYPNLLLVQTARDRERYIETGAPPEKVKVGGNLKYDAATAAGAREEIERFLDLIGPAAVWIAASTMPPARAGDVDEDDVVIEAFQQLRGRNAGLLLILVPRKPERFDVVEEKLAAAGVPFVRRSALRAGTRLQLPGVLLLDSMGELGSLFPYATVVFMGGTVAERGGHNILEPAAAARATIVGPHMENFAEIANEFRAARAVRSIENASELAGAVQELLADGAARDRMGTSARELARSKQGATAVAIATVLEARDAAVPHWRGRGPAWPLMWLLAQLWTAGNAITQKLKLARQCRLESPVISIGGINMGGAGKTPLAVFAAGTLHDTGVRAAVLTRGYRRHSLARAIIVPAGAKAPADVTGDEPQILISAGVADVGIGADRCATGRLLQTERRPDAFLLDDGFQHRRLWRDRDIVLIDALDPFSRGDVFPAGRLREPLSALRRASAFVITRAEPDRDYTGIRRVLARYNPAAPVFRSRVMPREWVEVETGEPVMLAHNAPAVAFCGLGNPAAFWRTLSTLEMEIRWRWAFADHHRYKAVELRRLANHARRSHCGLLVTTQKDAVNLPGNAARLVAPARLLWLRIETEIAEREEFIAFLRGAVDRVVIS